jgi:hypothetical protein
MSRQMISGFAIVLLCASPTISLFTIIGILKSNMMIVGVYFLFFTFRSPAKHCDHAA